MTPEMRQRKQEPGTAPEAAQTPDKPFCDFCGLSFAPKRKWQKFCCEDCRRGFEAIISRLDTVVRQQLREGVRRILHARR